MKYIDFLKYVKDSIGEVKEIKSVVYGSTDRLSEIAKSSVKYPAAWFSFPDIVEEEGEEITENWSFAIAVFENCEAGNLQKLEQIHNTTLELLRKVVSNIRLVAYESTLYSLSITLKYNILFPKTADNMQGWQVELELITISCLDD